MVGQEPSSRSELWAVRRESDLPAESDAAEIAAAMARSGLFRDVPSERLLALARKARCRHFVPGQVLLRQGSVGQEMYVLVRGRVRVERSHPILSEPIVLAELGPGDVVGEIGVLARSPRSATVLALEETAAAEIDAEVVAQEMLPHAEVAATLLRTMTTRQRSTEDLVKQMLHQGVEAPAQPEARMSGSQAGQAVGPAADWLETYGRELLAELDDCDAAALQARAALEMGRLQASTQLLLGISRAQEILTRAHREAQDIVMRAQQEAQEAIVAALQFAEAAEQDTASRAEEPLARAHARLRARIRLALSQTEGRGIRPVPDLPLPRANHG